MPKTKLLNCCIAKLLKNNSTISERKRAVTIQQFNNSSLGFTLIELLITISIIGILASISLVSYSAAQQKARDGVRKSDLAQVKRALELAKSDCQGIAYYPGPPTPGSGIEGAIGDFDTFLKSYLTASALKYISSVPQDPQNANNQRYGYNVGGTTLATACPNTAGTPNQQAGYGDYLLAVQLERATDADTVKSAANCAGKPNIANYTGTGWYFVCNN